VNCLYICFLVDLSSIFFAQEEDLNYQIRTSFFDEKAQAVLTIGVLAELCGTAFLPYLVRRLWASIDVSLSLNIYLLSFFTGKSGAGTVGATAVLH
jgi:hypothetical protein